jgi:hypothetical protein
LILATPESLRKRSKVEAEFSDAPRYTNKRSRPKKSFAATSNRMRPVHPGKALRDDYFQPRETSANAPAIVLKVLSEVRPLTN